MTTMYFKVLNGGGYNCNYRNRATRYNLPKKDKPGKWMPKIRGEIRCCHRGYHVATISQLQRWLGKHIWVAEVRGDSHNQRGRKGKSAWGQIRLVAPTYWNRYQDMIFLHLVADCVEYIVENGYYKKESSLLEKAVETLRTKHRVPSWAKKVQPPEMASASRRIRNMICGRGGDTTARKTTLSYGHFKVIVGGNRTALSWYNRRFKSYLTGSAGRAIAEEAKGGK